MSSASGLAALRALRRDVEGASGSFSLLGVFGGRRELPSPFFRPVLRRAEGWGVLAFSCMASEGSSRGGPLEPDSACDILPLPFLERAGSSCGSILLRLARLPRAGAASGVPWGCSGLDPRWAGFFRLREGAGAACEGAGGGGGGGGGSLASPADRRAAERVTLEDMSLVFCVVNGARKERKGAIRALGQTVAPSVGVAALFTARESEKA